MRFVLAITLLAAALFSGCNGTNTNTNSNQNDNQPSNANRLVTLPNVDPVKPTSPVDPSYKSCNPYFPLVPGSQIKYLIRFSSSLLADVNVVVDSAVEGGHQTFIETTQIIDKSGGLEKLEKTVRKYVCDGERIKVTYDKGNNRAGERANDVELKFKGVPIIMVDPASLKRPGTTWSYTFNQIFQVAGEAPIEPEESVTVTFEVLGEEEVTTPAGKFKTLRIARRVKDKQGVDYFAKGLGLVKRVGWDGTSWELREYGGVKPIE
jgi:hypothetical protein